MGRSTKWIRYFRSRSYRIAPGGARSGGWPGAGDVARADDRRSGGNTGAGAMGGGMAAIIRRRMMEKKQQHAAGQGQRSGSSAFDRAFKACMEGRGYTAE